MEQQPIAIENIDELKKRIARAGFGEIFNNEIDKNLSEGVSKFELKTTQQIENATMDFALEVNSKEGKAYFNGYRATIHQENKEPLSHWFKSDDRITMNEAYNMMADRDNPRAVHKTLYDNEGKSYGAWLQINFKKQTASGNNEVNRYHDKFGYNLLEKLNDYAFEGLETNKQKLAAYSLLEQGREIEITPVKREQHNKVFIKANPERKSITISDESGKFLSHDQFRTPEALERIQQQRNNNGSGTDLTAGTQQPAEELKKNLVNEPAEELKRHHKPRAVAPENKSKKSVSR